MILNPYVFSGGGTPPAPGDPFILSFTPNSLRSNFTGCVGFKFTAPGSSPPTAIALGRYKISGNSQTHTVYLLDASGSVLASVSLDMSGTAEADGFIYGVISFALTASQDYFVLSSEVSGGDEWMNQVTVDSNSGVVIFDNSAYQDGCAGLPTSTAAGTCYVPVNVKF
ncbi:MAG: hypothetical protein ABJB61_13915 [bacterium]